MVRVSPPETFGNATRVVPPETFGNVWRRLAVSGRVRGLWKVSSRGFPKKHRRLLVRCPGRRRVLPSGAASPEGSLPSGAGGYWMDGGDLRYFSVWVFQGKLCSLYPQKYGKASVWGFLKISWGLFPWKLLRVSWGLFPRKLLKIS
jgi:hypothetical protein